MDANALARNSDGSAHLKDVAVDEGVFRHHQLQQGGDDAQGKSDGTMYLAPKAKTNS